MATPKIPSSKQLKTYRCERLDKTKSLAYTLPRPPVFQGTGCAQIAQLVEQRIENPRVAGSIPALGTIFSISVSGG
jgi:hypothetical protein